MSKPSAALIGVGSRLSASAVAATPDHRALNVEPYAKSESAVAHAPSHMAVTPHVVSSARENAVRCIGGEMSVKECIRIAEIAEGCTPNDTQRLDLSTEPETSLPMVPDG